MARSKTLELLRKNFPGIEFNVRSKIEEEIIELIDDSRMPRLEPEEELFFVLKFLEKELTNAKRRLSKIKKKHKKGECTIEEVQDHEFFIIELEAEIEDIIQRLNGRTF